MGFALAVQQDMVDVRCAECDILFAIPARFETRRREDGNTFYCPLGHHLHFKSELDRLRKQVADQTRTNTELAARVAAAQKAEQAALDKHKRLERRVRRGVCPCCSRSFENLARHMATKHPEAAKA